MPKPDLSPAGTSEEVNPLSVSRNAGLGISYMIAAIVMFPFLNAAVKYLSVDYPIPQIIWMRYTVHLLIMIMIFAPKKGLGLFRTKHLGSQLTRSFLLFGSTSFYFTALFFMPMATTASINFIGPLVIVALSVPMLGEKVGVWRWGAVIGGFIGALIVIRPGGAHGQWPMLLPLGSVICYSLYQIITRRMATSDDSATTITYTAVVGAALSSLALPFFWITPLDWTFWAMTIVMGLFGGIGHFFVVKALTYAEASLLSPIGYGQLIGAVILGYLVFDDLPDIWTVIGAVVIVAAGLVVTYRERRIKAREQAKPKQP